MKNARLFSRIFNQKSKLILLLIFFPSVSQAAVSFSEVAWMGTADSANYEWIELHNDGEAADVTGWTVSDGANLSIELSGTIPANSHVVLERTSDASAAGGAFLIYTGALVNTGATLFIKKLDGSLVDQVSGGENWINIGGDNVTKETAQYTNSGWVTAVATPGRGLSAGEVSVATANNDKTETKSESVKSSTETKVSKASSNETVKLTIPDVTLKLLISGQKVGYVNQAIKFSIKASDIGKHLIDSLQYEWNFGDTMTGSGKDVNHSFAYPGTYVVTVYGGYKRQEQVARHEITILPVTVSLTKNDNGDVQINNDSPYEIDISGYKIQTVDKFVFPARSIILPNQTITIPKKKLGNNTSLVTLFDNQNSLVTTTIKSVKNDFVQEVLPSVSALSRVNDIEVISISEDDKFGFVPPLEITKVDDSELVNSESNSNTIDLVSTSSQLANPLGVASINNERWPYLALVILIALGIYGVYLRPKSNQSA